MVSRPALRSSALASQVSSAKLGTSLSFHMPAKANSGWSAQADAVAANSDIMHTYRDLLATSRSGQRKKASLERKKYSPSLFVVHFGIKGTWPGIPHHITQRGNRREELQGVTL